MEQVCTSVGPSFDTMACIICGDSSTIHEKLSTVTEVGIETLRASCKIRQRHDMLSYLDSVPCVVLVHASCRKSFTRSKDIKKLKLEFESPVNARVLRSDNGSFLWKSMCFFCASPVTGESSARRVCTLELRNNLLQKCSERSDQWAVDVRGRLETCIDLVAEEAVYHKLCHTRFANGLTPAVGELSCGRPLHTTAVKAFADLCYILETTCEENLYTLDELHEKMKCLATDDTNGDLYTVKHMKRLLKERYGDSIFFAEVNGRKNVVGFRNLCQLLISNKWRSDTLDDTNSERVVKDAARLIASEIREMKYSTDVYPNACEVGDISEENEKMCLPPLLLLFIKSLIRPRLKQNSIAQALVQAARPQSCMMPLLFGLGVQLDHEFGSEFLLQQLSRLGFCASYDEVARFKSSVMQSSDNVRIANVLDNVDINVNSGDPFTQFVADNVDHNVRTLDGNNTFHGMGIIAATPLKNKAITGSRILRLARCTNISDVCKDSAITIVDYNMKPSSGLDTVTLESIRSLQSPVVMPPVTNVNLLWHMYGLRPNPTLQRPSWSGFMQTVCIGQHPPVSYVHILPILDLKSTDLSCIYTTLLFVRDQAKKFNIVPCVTFDQPLYVKALDISTAANLGVVCRLGGFHTLMNFLGAIGHVMKGSGLEEMMGLLYGPNTVEHTVSGKAYSRSIRGHFIIHDALVQLLMLNVLERGVEEADCDSADNMSASSNDDIYAMVDRLYQQCWNDKIVVENCSNIEYHQLIDIACRLQELKRTVSAQSRTGKLWTQYMQYVDLVKLFLVAERTSDWCLHLTVCQQMLNVLAAAGHNNYAKACRIYVQEMYKLSDTHPTLFQQFANGNHTIRRSDRMWAGLSCDLVIEQTLMKSVKGRGGLTRGRGMHDSVRYVWTNTMAECASFHLAMSTLTGLCSHVQDHVEVSAARIKRDESDLRKVKAFLTDNNPFRFVDTHSLVSLSSGVVASPDDVVTCDMAEELGLMIHQKWDGIKFSEICAKKRDQVKTLADMTSVCTLGKESVSVDVSKLFHRLLIVAERSGDISGFFSFELTQYPTSMFTSGFMRKADKPSLYRQAAEGLMSEAIPSRSQYQFVVDGGCLLHRVRWQRGRTCAEVLDLYVYFVNSKFGNEAVIVFDGYENSPHTKDHEHRRRRSKASKVAPSVHVESTTPIMFDQEPFLANIQNKTAFITVLMRRLSDAGIPVHQARGDADTDIVSVALHLARSSDRPVSVYADDTDVLCMLLYHCCENKPVVFWSEGRKSNAKCINIAQLQQKLGSDICKSILVLHALGGCDTTSAIFGIGKGTVLKKLGNRQYMKNIDVLQNELSTCEEVRKAGLQLLAVLYAGQTTDTLNVLRYVMYVKLISSSLGKLQPEKLPPTEQAGYFHACRVHLQAVEWKTLSSGTLCPTDWGWNVESGQLTPIATDLAIAPQEILKIVRCGCKASCSSNMCTCRKAGLQCMRACKCCGDCDNAEHQGRDFYDFDDSEIIFDDDIDWIAEETVV